MTPQQEESLNRAIAAHKGTNIHNGMIFQADYCLHMDVYTESLDAIVEVVRKWLKSTNRKKTRDDLDTALHKSLRTTLAWVPAIDFIELEQPALALCLAFAQAANLKGDWNE